MLTTGWIRQESWSTPMGVHPGGEAFCTAEVRQVALPGRMAPPRLDGLLAEVSLDLLETLLAQVVLLEPVAEDDRRSPPHP